MKPAARVALFNGIALFPTVLVSIGASIGALALANYALASPGPYAIVLNVVPALLVGLAIYAPLARFLSRGSRSRPPHLGRAAPMYIVSVLFGTIILTQWSEPGFGLVAQLFVWPCIAVFAGIIGEFLGWRSSRPTGEAPI